MVGLTHLIVLGNGLIGTPQGPKSLGFLSKHVLHVLTLGLMWGIQRYVSTRSQAGELTHLFTAGVPLWSPTTSQGSQSAPKAVGTAGSWVQLQP